MLIHFRVKITPNKTKETNRKPCCFSKGCVKGVSFSVEAKQSLCFIVIIFIIFVCLFSTFSPELFIFWLFFCMVRMCLYVEISLFLSTGALEVFLKLLFDVMNLEMYFTKFCLSLEMFETMLLVITKKFEMPKTD